MPELILVFKLNDEKTELAIDISRKALLSVRDALREAGIEANVIVKQEPKILD
jgi:hypothetical protein